ncbi:sensor histidine kinase [Pseudorhodobacter aquimaris]|uniref:sensor histidine kinase n=1 Tax=Pseudorhodobacter aquimaris TaxID=687412 RepID=UPI0009F91F18|nr:HAMP domain-containing sensor histidine kinase [Pseudorhodobacter aquimaris]
MLAEVLIFVPSIARFRQDYLQLRLEKAQIASLALLATDGMISTELEAELLANADVYNVVLWRDQIRQLILSSPVDSDVIATHDLRVATPLRLMRDALVVLIDNQDRTVRVIGRPVQDAGFLIEVTMPTAPLRQAMLDYGLRIFLLSALISVVTAALLFFAVRRLLVVPIRRVVRHMTLYADAPEDARRVIAPTSGVAEVREAEEALQSLQTQLTGALRQKERLAQLGSAVAKISHDLRNILTTAQLFTDRIEHSVDPVVTRIAPKLVGSISRAVSLCESTLAFGKAEEPSPRLSRFALAPLVEEVIEAEALGERQGVSCLVDISAGMNLRADAEQLYRVLANLMRNAMQALEVAGQGGIIEVSAGETDDEWWIKVGDTGPGLPPRAREHLFTAFQGGARKGGSGLGLAIAFELVRGHGGRLELLRSDEAGTEFVIHLPKTDGLEDTAQHGSSGDL